ncbi:hypothetical protein, partial [Scytonema sp. HK-05]|uniref:hypothetical protein n=1 Tax=Scytonema sp. HK-05 TaxID=1137095 RepID=UPI001E368BD9
LAHIYGFMPRYASVFRSGSTPNYCVVTLTFVKSCNRLKKCNIKKGFVGKNEPTQMGIWVGSREVI